MKHTQKNSAIDQHGINAVLRAIEAELGARAAKRGKKLSAHLMGGGELTATGIRDFGQFATTKNLDIIYVSMNQSQPHEALASSELEFTYFATDGISESLVQTGGRIWMRDLKAQPRLIFDFVDPLEVFAKSNGKFDCRPGVNWRYHDEGFTLARQCLQKRISLMRPSTPILSTVGSTPVVFDLQTLLRGMTGE